MNYFQKQGKIYTYKSKEIQNPGKIAEIMNKNGVWARGGGVLKFGFDRDVLLQNLKVDPYKY